MNKLIIYEYISRIKKDDINRFGINQGLKLEDYEIDIIYHYIKNDYKKIMSYPDEILENIKYKVRDITYHKLIELYNKYKEMLN